MEDPPRPSELARVLSVATFARAAWDWSLARARRAFGEPAADDFEAWSTHRDGRTLHELIASPYAAKSTGVAAARLDAADWIARRPPPSFHSPTSGGIGAIAQALAAAIEARGGAIRLCAGFVRIESSERAARRVVWEREGVERELACDAVVGAIPITELARGLSSMLPEHALEGAATVEHVSMLYAYLEVATERVLDGHWTTLPGEHVRVHRVSEPKNFASSDAPRDRTVLCCEIACRFGDATWRLDPRSAMRIAAEDLALAGIVARGRTRPIDYVRARFARPVPVLGHVERVRALHAEIERSPNLVLPSSREYSDPDDLGASLAAGVDAAKRLVQRLERAPARVPFRARHAR